MWSKKKETTVPGQKRVSRWGRVNSFSGSTTGLHLGAPGRCKRAKIDQGERQNQGRAEMHRFLKPRGTGLVGGERRKGGGEANEPGLRKLI